MQHNKREIYEPLWAQDKQQLVPIMSRLNWTGRKMTGGIGRRRAELQRNTNTTLVQTASSSHEPLPFLKLADLQAVFIFLLYRPLELIWLWLRHNCTTTCHESSTSSSATLHHDSPNNRLCNGLKMHSFDFSVALPFFLIMAKSTASDDYTSD